MYTRKKELPESAARVFDFGVGRGAEGEPSIEILHTKIGQLSVDGDLFRPGSLADQRAGPETHARPRRQD